MKVLRKLEKLGYRFQLEGGEQIKFKYEGKERPDPAVVKPLLEELKARKSEAFKYLQAREEEWRCKVIPFPYPINETLGIGEYDPLDVRWVNGKPVLDPGWWKRIPKGRSRDRPGRLLNRLPDRL